MPLDIEMNTDMPKIEVRSSKTIELVTAVSLLSDIKHHQFAKGWASTAHNKISRESFDTLKLISNLMMQGLGLLEFILESRLFDDVEDLLNKLLEYDDVDFIYKLTIEELSHEEIKALQRDRGLLKTLIEEKKWLVNGNSDILEHIIYDTENFKNSLIELLREVSDKDFDEKIGALKEQYNHQINDLNNKLMKQEPLDLAQEIMGKKFGRVFDFKEYIFIPCFFISPHNIRIFSKKAQMVVYDLRNNRELKKEEGERLSSSLKIISDKTRLEILRLLISKANYGKVIADRVGLTTATISHHLEQLKSMNLVTEDRVKNYKYFKANEEEIDQLLEDVKAYLYNK